MKNRSRVFITYECSGSHDFRLVGNTQNTGNWDPAKAVPLVQSENSYSVEIDLPLDSVFEYKYLKWGGSIIWEPFSNRKIKCTNKVIHVTDNECSPISRVSLGLPSKPHRTSEKLLDLKEDTKFLLTDSVMFVNFNLPIKVSRNPDPSSKWLVESNKGIWLPFLYDLTVDKNINVRWVGYPGIVLENEEEKKSLSEYLSSNYKCYPVYLTSKEVTNFQFFCNKILFPVFCNIVHVEPQSAPQYSIEQWELFKSVNSIFSEVIMNNYTNQVIWINDFCLGLTPNFVSRRIHDLLNIGFYLQSPFPSTQVFKVLPQAESILHSMLACDLVSFHSYEYASNFLMACKNVIGIDHHFSKAGYLFLEYYGRHVMVRVGDIGTETDKIKACLKTVDFLQLKRSLDEKYRQKQVLLGIDNLNHFSGIFLKFEAFEQFKLKSNDSAVLVQFLTTYKINVPSEAEALKLKVTELRDRINNRLGGPVIEVYFQDLSYTERYALMSISSAFINTTIKDSICLIAYEFLVVNKDKYKPVVVSENAGVSKSLRSFIKINPFSKQSILEGLESLRMSHKYQPCRDHDTCWVSKNTMKKWAFSFLTDLKKSRKNPKLLQYMKHGMGDKMKLVALKKNFSKLDLDAMVISYKRARHRIMFFDNEGTLAQHLKASDQNICTVTNKIIDCLRDICQDPQNIVFIITGRQKEVLENTYAIPNLCLAAEFGGFIKWSDSAWESRTSTQSLWKETAKYIIESYVLKTEGSYIEEKENSVVFQYKDTEIEYGNWQAKELITQLDIYLKPFIEDCEVLEGTGYVEVKPRFINKGYTVEYILEECFGAGIVFDFVLVVGDDSSDEEMFKMMKEMTASKNHAIQDNAKCFSCTLGRKPSEADYYLNDVSEIASYLEALRHWSRRDFNSIQQIEQKFHVVDVVRSKRLTDLEE